MDYKLAIDTAVDSARFRIDDCIEFESSLEPAQLQECNIIKAKLSAREYKAFSSS